jgi:hypothetical protein
MISSVDMPFWNVLAGAGLRARHQVAPGKYQRNSLLLDGRGLLVAKLGYGSRQRWNQAELFEGRSDSLRL